MRLFVAVWPPPPVVDVLAALERPAAAGVRWTDPAQWHVTLRFLGDVAEDSVPDVVAALADVAARLAPAEAVLGSALAAFGPSVLYAPVDGLAAWADPLGAGRASGRSVAARATEPGTAFVGHVTVARGRRGRGPQRGDVRPLVGTALPAGPRTWVADSFALVRSHLGHDGARYETLALFGVGDHPHTNTRSQLR